MPQSSAKQFSGIFVSYRRDDSAGHAGRLSDKLSDHFGKEQIFMDIDNIQPGEDFVQVIENAVGSCEILIAVIGRNWLTGTGRTTGPLSNPNDFVRLEIATALKRDIRVIPVLVQRATMPNPKDLPDDLAKLSRRNALELTDTGWQRDVDQLINAIEATRDEHAVRRPTPLAAREFEPVPRPLPGNRRLLIVAAALMVVAVIAVVLFKMRSASRESPAAATAKTTPPPITTSAGIELVWIPAGNFMMGSETGSPVEGPQHRVTISQGFYMGKYEVTQTQWQKVLGNNPSYFIGGNLPVEQVSWYAAQTFIGRLNATDAGYTYRLPTEAEWEYACRAGTTAELAGNVDAMAWYGNNSGRTRLNATDMWQNDHANYFKRIDENGGQTHPVGTKQPNSFGLFDMQGNVAEWVEDWYHGSYAEAPADGSAWLSDGEQQERVARGRTWYELAPRCAERGWLSPDVKNNGYGLRVVAVVKH